jgi:hypothetical protein
VPAGVVARPSPYHVRAHYDHLWRRQVQVEPALLLHDAALFCLADWHPTAFREAVNSVGAAVLDFNSRDAVAAMVYLSAIRARRGSPREATPSCGEHTNS